MPYNLSEKARLVEQSLTLKLSARSKELTAKGIRVINMTAGECDLPVPRWALDKTKVVVEMTGTNVYQPTAGIKKLRESIAEKYRKYNNVNYSYENVLVSIGAKHAIYLALFSIINPGDEVVIISPYWVSYSEQVKLVGGNPVLLPTSIENGFKPSIDDIKRAITPKTKLIMINSPSNPTGAVYDVKFLEEVYKLALLKEIYVLSDEIYENFVYEGEFVSFASFDEKAKNITIVVNGFSKSHSVTGWRIGYVCANKELIEVMDSVQSHISSGTSSLVQFVFEDFVKYYEEDMKRLSVFRERRDYIYGELKNAEQIRIFKPQGAFYFFIDVSKLYNDRIKNSVDFCEALLEKKQVLVVPGVAFGDDRYIRISFATSMENIREGIKRFKEFITELSS